MNHCPHCGNEIPDGAAYCPSCGKSIEIKPANPAIMIAYWLIQAYSAYTKRPQQLTEELFMIACGFITSFIFYRILRYKVGTLAITIITILTGMLGYVIVPIILSIILLLINKPA